ncbi:MAG: GNAT family N-acetyltransferase [Pyrinomonadaceae bacterium]
MMISSLALKHLKPHRPPRGYSETASTIKVFPLSNKDAAEVLAFLAQRPLQTIIMSGLIRDNGVVNPLNRGVFHAARNPQNELTGVALIGHITIVETHDDATLETFARLAQINPQAVHVILGESEQVSHLQQCYAEIGQHLRRACREELLEQRWPVEVREAVRELRYATLDELPQVMAVQATMAYEESGVNPLEVDPLGFRLRCARRIEQNRVWVCTEGEQLNFKADIMSETPETIYLEGVYVAPEMRGKGYGLRCFSQLSRTLLTRAQSLCLLVNEQNQQAIKFYARAGYKRRGHVDTVYLNSTAKA